MKHIQLLTPFALTLITSAEVFAGSSPLIGHWVGSVQMPLPQSKTQTTLNQEVTFEKATFTATQVTSVNKMEMSRIKTHGKYRIEAGFLTVTPVSCEESGMIQIGICEDKSQNFKTKYTLQGAGESQTLTLNWKAGKEYSIQFKRK